MSFWIREMLWVAVSGWTGVLLCRQKVLSSDPVYEIGLMLLAASVWLEHVLGKIFP